MGEMRLNVVSGDSSTPRTDDTSAKEPRIAKSSGEISPRNEMMTTELDPKHLAGLLAQAAAASAREERATEQIQPIDLQLLRDQAQTDLVGGELDPRIVRALLSAAPPLDPPAAEARVADAPVEAPPIEVRDRRHHDEVAPFAKPPLAAIPVDVVPSPVAWHRMIVVAAIIVAIVVMFAVTQ